MAPGPRRGGCRPGKQVSAQVARQLINNQSRGRRQRLASSSDLGDNDNDHVGVDGLEIRFAPEACWWLFVAWRPPVAR